MIIWETESEHSSIGNTKKQSFVKYLIGNTKNNNRLLDMSSFGNTIKKPFVGITNIQFYRIPKKKKVMSAQELKDKVDRIAPTSTPSNYMLPKDVSFSKIVISTESAHARTLVPEAQFRS